ncbi:somatostatin-1A-like [Rhincodon typus]|uniref:somatostatin-1A-like n=1 Tax=Rhincodon typus TaxID=259920 RepID=UPI0009A2F880|nr:somatostatin-1A-like [Rhincodon typus]
MSRSQTHLLLTLISVTLLLLRSSGTARGESLPDILQKTNPEEKEELSRVMVLKLLSELLRADSPALPRFERRGLGQNQLLRRWNTPRDRKAGCKNFFWKTFTSC